MQSITFERFVVQAGSDGAGVATSMISVNSTVKLTFRNTATFFGIHVASTPMSVSYSELAIGSGDVSSKILNGTVGISSKKHPELESYEMSS